MKPKTKRFELPKPAPQLEKTHRFTLKLRKIAKEQELKKGKK